MAQLHAKTFELLSKIKSGHNRLSMEHVEILISDYERLGADTFKSLAAAVIESQANTPPQNTDETKKRLEQMTKRTTLPRDQFFMKVLAHTSPALPPLRKKDLTLPKVLAHFRLHATEEMLLSLAGKVARENTNIHDSRPAAA